MARAWDVDSSPCSSVSVADSLDLFGPASSDEGNAAEPAPPDPFDVASGDEFFADPPDGIPDTFDIPTAFAPDVSLAVVVPPPPKRRRGRQYRHSFDQVPSAVAVVPAVGVGPIVVPLADPSQIAFYSRAPSGLPVAYHPLLNGTPLDRRQVDFCNSKTLTNRQLICQSTYLKS